MRLSTIVCLASALSVLPVAAVAQPLGTFRWQLQPFCNVITVTVVQDGGQYHIDGTDDQCGAARRAAVVGLAFPNPDGSVGFGLTTVTTPNGAPVHVDARITLAALGGPWADSAGNSGTFTFTPGAGTGGSARPQPPTVPRAILLDSSGSIAATGTAGVGAAPATGPGVRMMWHAGKAALRAGEAVGPEWDDVNVGYASTALGLQTSATAIGSTALGEATVASGRGSTAMGGGVRASGDYGTAMGLVTVASGSYSVAGGDETKASGIAATAFGTLTIASGANALAAGNRTTASGGDAVALGNQTIAGGTASLAGGRFTTATGADAFAFGVDAAAAGAGSVVLGRTARTAALAPGSFMFADRSTSAPFESVSANEFGARFAGGYYLYTRPDLGSGVALAANGSSWAPLSDANAKENFRDVDGEGVLAKLAGMSIGEWNYKAQDASIRHMGPTAQEFRAAFGLGDFPLRINTVDADGVALAAIKALEARTRRENDELRARLARLEALQRR